ncbi:hypothetical protein ACB092_07G093600 [Castanea dentata]
MNPFPGKQTHTLSFKPWSPPNHHQQPTTATISLSRSAYPLRTAHLKGERSPKRHRSNLVAAELTQSIFFLKAKCNTL